MCLYIQVQVFLLQSSVEVEYIQVQVFCAVLFSGLLQDAVHVGPAVVIVGSPGLLLCLGR